MADGLHVFIHHVRHLFDIHLAPSLRAFIDFNTQSANRPTDGRFSWTRVGVAFGFFLLILALTTTIVGIARWFMTTESKRTKRNRYGQEDEQQIDPSFSRSAGQSTRYKNTGKKE